VGANSYLIPFLKLGVDLTPTADIKLIGGLYNGSADGVIDFLKDLFPRLTREIGHIGDVSRYVAYTGSTTEDDFLLFLSLEVSRIENIPEGMMAWHLQNDTWTVLEPQDGQDCIVWQGDLTWQWIDGSLGEFTANCPSSWGCSNLSTRSFRIHANGYLGASEAWDDDIQLVEYDPSWPEKYREMENYLYETLGTDLALKIEHYGSTSIPGMPAKPIIDILVEVSSFDEARKHIIPLFNRPECECWWYADHTVVIIREKMMGKRTHHIHIAPAGHKLWEGLTFRDYLRTYPEDASRYASLKYELAKLHQTDREAYTEAKTSFVKEILAKASVLYFPDE